MNLIKRYKIHKLKIKLSDAQYELRKWYHNDIRRPILIKDVDILLDRIKKLRGY